ncbi:hypothetical protein ACF0H5_018607 [Mactra antiquata]
MADSPPSVSIGESPIDPDMTSPLYTINMMDSNTTGIPDVSLHNNCDTIDTNYDIPTSVICAMCFIFGIVYTFFGYRFFKAVMFLTGFLFASVLVYMICLELKTFNPLINAGISVGAGFLFGLLTMLVQYIGLFMTGFNFGISIGTGVLIILELFIENFGIRWIPIGILAGCGLICALLTLKFQKSGTIFGTSMFGGLLMISCMDYFIEHFTLMMFIWDKLKAVHFISLCWFSWIILGCWPFCFLVGTITQWKITGHGYNHREVVNSRATESLIVKRPRSKDPPKENPHQSRYRHLYQVRRVNGDVISQNYIQSIQSKLSPSLRRMTPVPTEPLPEQHTEPESTNTTLTQIPEV